MMSHIKQRWENITKSENDDRQYRGLELNNGMKMLLISDTLTDKAAACMDVNIGSMSDPKSLPGLAHFCEHMLFLGTEKYPIENEYNKFLSEHAGASNAFTSAEHTNFYFDISPAHVKGAMERFAEFFRTPLFTESATEREVNAVNSENEKNLMNDNWRIIQLDRSLCDPNHDFNHFCTGNKKTLMDDPQARGDNVRAALLDFHKKFYSSNIMAFTVLAKESLDELENLAVELFHDVPNSDVQIPSWTKSPWTEEFLKHKIYVVPVNDVRELRITWPIPDYTKNYKTGPGYYLAHLVGHESKGSLLSELKSRGWVNGLVSGAYAHATGISTFDTSVDLTEDGLENYNEIVKLIFQYLNMLRETGPQLWVFEEERSLLNLRFQFKDKEKPQGYVSDISQKMLNYPMEDLLSANYLLSEYKPELISECLNCLTPDNCRMFVVTQDFEDHCVEVEKWYGTHYLNKPIPDDLLQSWSNCGLNEKLFMPKKNEFIATDFTLKHKINNQVSPYPRLLLDNERSRLWFKQDDSFKRPKAYLSFRLLSHSSSMDPLHEVLTNLFVNNFNDTINEDTYDATLAGLSVYVHTIDLGIAISVSGYNHKIEVLLSHVLKKLVEFKVNPNRFESIKEMFFRSLKNFEMDQPYIQGAYFLNFLISENMWLNQEKLAVKSEATMETLEKFIPTLFSRVFIETLAYGNLEEEDAMNYQKLVEDTLSNKLGSTAPCRGEIILSREVLLPAGSHHVFQRLNNTQTTSSTEVYLQFPQQNTHNNVMLELILQMMSEPCFNKLRTEEQLGYIVFSYSRFSNFMQGVSVIVQSNRKPEFLEERIEAFFAYFLNKLESMKDEEFQSHVQALYDRLTEKPKNMGEQNWNDLSEIANRQYYFNRETVESEYLKTLPLCQVIEFYKKHVMPESGERRLLSVHIISTKTHGESLPALSDTYKGKMIEDALDFKCSLPLSPLAPSMVSVGKGAAKL